MNQKNINKNFKIVLSVGDESGVGPEIILKALSSHAFQVHHFRNPVYQFVDSRAAPFVWLSFGLLNV